MRNFLANYRQTSFVTVNRRNFFVDSICLRSYIFKCFTPYPAGYLMLFFSIRTGEGRRFDSLSRYHNANKPDCFAYSVVRNVQIGLAHTHFDERNSDPCNCRLYVSLRYHSGAHVFLTIVVDTEQLHDRSHSLACSGLLLPRR